MSKAQVDSENLTQANPEDQELIVMLQQIQNLPDEKKKVLKDLMDAYLFRERVRKECSPYHLSPASSASMLQLPGQAIHGLLTRDGRCSLQGCDIKIF
ncbi:MAG: hypothetical protein JJT78_16585 [Leptospira sp.]|nr:hypothetical protein [Leptospira sp.]